MGEGGLLECCSTGTISEIGMLSIFKVAFLWKEGFPVLSSKTKINTYQFAISSN